MPTHNNLQELLTSKVGQATISRLDNDTQKCQELTVFMLDNISADEKNTFPISINIQDEEKECIYDYLGLHNWSSCDYLHICIKGKPGNKIATLYFIEQTDIANTFRNKMKHPDKIKMPKITNLIGELVKQLETTNREYTANIREIELKLRVQLIIYSLVAESRRKFFAAMYILSRLQMKQELASYFPKKQIYHFALLDAPRKKEFETGDRNITRMIEQNIKKYEDEIFQQISGPIDVMSSIKDNPAIISIGKSIYGFPALIKHIDEQKHQTN